MSNLKPERIRQFNDLKILVLGDSMLDVYDFCYTAHSRPSPEKLGKRVYSAERSLRTLGGAGNVAANLSTLGVSTVLISVCGNDGQYLTLRELAAEHNIHSFFIRDESRITGTKTRLYIDDEYLLRRDDEVTHPIHTEVAEQVYNEFLRELKGADAVVLSDYNKGFFTKELSQKLIDECNAREVPVIIDFKPPNKEFFKGAKAIAPNLIEAKDIISGFSVEENLEGHMKALYQELGAQIVFVTLGAKGICYQTADEFKVIPAFTVDAIDAVGCGDTVRCALALGFACKLDLEDIALFANAAAAVVVQKLGTATVSQSELIAFLEQRFWNTLSSQSVG